MPFMACKTSGSAAPSEIPELPMTTSSRLALGSDCENFLYDCSSRPADGRRRRAARGRQ
jgi:hypothetical protein